MAKTSAEHKRDQRKRDEKKGFERFEMVMGASTKQALREAAERAGLDTIEELIGLIGFNLKNLDRSEFEKLTAIPRHTIDVSHYELPGEQQQ